MNRIFIEDLKNHIDSEVTVQGWVDVRRDHGKLIFIDLRDMTGKVQMVALPNHEDAHKLAETVRPEWVVSVTGKVNARPERMVKEGELNGELEIEVLSIEVLSEASELPFEKDAEVNLDTYLDYLPLTLRTKRGQDIFKVQATIVEAFRDSMRNKKFIEFQSPGLVAGDAEGGAEVFEIPYFNEKTAYLATSPQFYKQIMVGVHERVFTTPRAFRAEKHATTRHLNEYITLDCEFGFIKDHTDVMDVHEQVIKDIVSSVTNEHSKILEVFEVETPLVPEKFPVMKLREAQELIKKETGKDKTNEPDLEPEDERFLCEYSRKNLGSDFIFITHYPVSKRPFYTYEDEEDLGFTKGFDLLYRGVEITTGGQRIHNHDKLVENMKKWKLDPEKFSYYLQTFKYGMPPHGGCATGLERLTQKFLGLASVKEATLFPRDINRIDKRLSE
ncbi:aspartate--tRNA(Asn) ligase [Candidatus Wolfebacteria bacterium]|nr:MAG: aspartate--tRNA(Asn) ligase [Candidatus Wolfebacteria bacterium]